MSDTTHHPDEEFEKALVKFESAVGQHEYIFSRDPVGSDAQDAGRRKAEAKKKLIDSHQTAISLAREEERKKNNWQPIKTAPRDGTWFLAVATEPGWGATRIVRFVRPDDRLPMHGEGLMWPSPPTHWMPLPSPPKEV